MVTKTQNNVRFRRSLHGCGRIRFLYVEFRSEAKSIGRILWTRWKPLYFVPHAHCELRFFARKLYVFAGRWRPSDAQFQPESRSQAFVALYQSCLVSNRQPNSHLRVSLESSSVDENQSGLRRLRQAVWTASGRFHTSRLRQVHFYLFKALSGRGGHQNLGNHDSK